MNRVDINHSVVIISFNQEGTIIAAIDSILKQTLQPFELVVLDDCSQDKTAEVAKSFLETKSPSFAWRVIKNEINLGIPKNTKKIDTVVNGNIITHLSGDDRLDPECVEICNGLIIENKLNPNEDLIISVSPIRLIFPNCDRIINYKILNNSLKRSIIRKSVPFVKIGFSKIVFSKIEYPSDIGVWADWYWDVSICMQQNIKFYEILKPLYWYTPGVGISSKISDKKLKESYLKAAKLIIKNFTAKITFLDRIFLLGEIAYLKGELDKSILMKVYGFILYLINIITCFDMITFKSLTIRYVPSKLYQYIKNND